MHNLKVHRSLTRSLLVAVALLVAAGGGSPKAQVPQVVSVPPEDVTYILPVYEQYAQVSDQQLVAEADKLRNAVGPEGPYVRIGFTTYVLVPMNSWTVDPADRAAVKAQLAPVIAQIDEDIRKAQIAGVPICMSFLTATRSTTDPLQTAAQNEDVRNTQWYGGGDLDRNNQPIEVDNTISSGWMTHSRYAGKLQTVQEAYIRELGKVIGDRMAQYPDIFVAAAGDGEVELSYDKTGIADVAHFDIAHDHLADYSPFAILEFRDWLTGTGRYADGADFAGQSYAQSAKYRNGASINLDAINHDFQTAFESPELKYFPWTLGQELSTQISMAAYDNGANRHTVATVNGFDAPRLRNWTSPWYQVWLEFRRQMVYRHNLDFARWITTNEGAEVPATKWYAYQIPADYVLSLTPDNPENERFLTSASSWASADVYPYGGVGSTAFNIYYPNQICESVDPAINWWCRTLANVAPQVATRNRRYALLEWHPGVGDNDAFLPGSDIYTEEMKLLLKYRPQLIAPYALYNAADQDPLKPYKTFPFYNEPPTAGGGQFPAMLKKLAEELNKGATATPDPRIVVDTPADGAIVAQPFNITGYAVDLGTISGSGRGTGIEKVDIYATRTDVSGATEVSLGRATYGADRTDASLYGPQFVASGFTKTITGLAPGHYQLRIEATSKNVQTPTVTNKPINITIQSNPTLTLESPTAGPILQPFHIIGWTRDAAAQSDLGIDTVTITKTIGGVTTSVATINSFSARPGIPECAGQFANCGFDVPISGLAPGSYTFTATARSAVDGTYSQPKSVQITLPATDPAMSVDTPKYNDTLGSSFVISGFAIDRADPTTTGISRVNVFALPLNSDGTVGAGISVGEATYGSARADIGAAYGTRFTNSGFTLTVSGLAARRYRLVVYSESKVEIGKADQRTIDVDVSATQVSVPLMSIDGPQPNATVYAPFLTGGWAIDRASTNGPGIDAVHVWAYPIVNGGFGDGIFVAPGLPGGVRSDVAAFYGQQFAQSGFTFTVGVGVLPPGPYLLVVYARSTVTGTFNQDKRVPITVKATDPVMSIDGPAEGSVVQQPFLTGGWAIDRASYTNPGTDAVHVWAYPKLADGSVDPDSTHWRFVVQGQGGGTRTDVGDFYGRQFDQSGFTFVVSGLPPGQYILGVYARSVITNQFQGLFRNITVH